jgi:predicted nucleic acid-binding protein
VKTWLLDTGPLIAYLDAVDPAHAAVAERLDGFTGQLVTTGAVLTEAMHFVSGTVGGAKLLADFATASSLRVYDLCQPPELHPAAALMDRYADTPMDFADATLLLLAEGLQVEEILTLDRRGFSTFRTRMGKALRQVLLEL